MLIEHYSIKDNKIAFKSLITAHNDADAVRKLENTVNAPQENEISLNASDFELWHIGTFDDQTGIFNQTQPRFICRASEYQKPKTDIKFEDLQEQLKLLQQTIAYSNAKTREDFDNVQSKIKEKINEIAKETANDKEIMKLFKRR